VKGVAFGYSVRRENEPVTSAANMPSMFHVGVMRVFQYEQN
jgi:hypothetical protein